MHYDFEFLYVHCPGCNNPFYIVTYYIKWVTTSWTHSMRIEVRDLKVFRKFFIKHNKSFRWHLGDYEKNNFFAFEGLGEEKL